MNLWKNYTDALWETFPDFQRQPIWADWTGKRGTRLTAQVYTHEHFIKSREVDIWDEKSSIYNNILYPKTGSNLPCFGMDLMGFSENKVIIVFDFQHPVENYVYEVESLPYAEKDYRFFEMGNHFSKNIYVRYCSADQVDDYLPMFKTYLLWYRHIVEEAQPTEGDISVYKDFDAYMTKLDPVGGYLAGKFGKEKSQSLVNDFLFCYK
tara:strand:- start:107 stop:730 length:624 start_codon:yes stop_codon:yes gene_type:complete